MNNMKLIILKFNIRCILILR